MSGEPGIAPDWEGLAARFGIPPDLIGQAAVRYREAVMGGVRGLARGETFVAPSVAEVLRPPAAPAPVAPPPEAVEVAGIEEAAPEELPTAPPPAPAAPARPEPTSTGLRFFATSAGMAKGYWAVKDRETGQTLEVKKSETAARASAQAMNYALEKGQRPTISGQAPTPAPPAAPAAEPGETDVLVERGPAAPALAAEEPEWLASVKDEYKAAYRAAVARAPEAVRAQLWTHIGEQRQRIRAIEAAESDIDTFRVREGVAPKVPNRAAKLKAAHAARENAKTIYEAGLRNDEDVLGLGIGAVPDLLRSAFP